MQQIFDILRLFSWIICINSFIFYKRSYLYERTYVKSTLMRMRARESTRRFINRLNVQSISVMTLLGNKHTDSTVDAILTFKIYIW